MYAGALDPEINRFNIKISPSADRLPRQHRNERNGADRPERNGTKRKETGERGDRGGTLKAAGGAKSQVAAGGKPISRERIVRAFMLHLCHGLMHLWHKILDYLQSTDCIVASASVDRHRFILPRFASFPSTVSRFTRLPQRVRMKFKRGTDRSPVYFAASRLNPLDPARLYVQADTYRVGRLLIGSFDDDTAIGTYTVALLIFS